MTSEPVKAWTTTQLTASGSLCPIWMGELDQRVMCSDCSRKEQHVPFASAFCKQSLIWWHLTHNEIYSKVKTQVRIFKNIIQL